MGSIETFSATERNLLAVLKGKEMEGGQVAVHLLGLGLCLRCIFRMLLVREVRFYREDPEVCFLFYGFISINHALDS